MRGWTVVNWACHGLLGVGLFAPAFTVTPRLEPHDELARWLGLLDDPATYSLAGGIRRLVLDGHAALGVLLFLFSVAFPVAKLALVRAALREGRSGPVHRWLARTSKFSMADVFVLALVVVAAKTFPGGTTVDLHYGAYVFAAAALASTLTCFSVQSQAQSGGL